MSNDVTKKIEKIAVDVEEMAFLLAYAEIGACWHLLEMADPANSEDFIRKVNADLARCKMRLEITAKIAGHNPLEWFELMDKIVLKHRHTVHDIVDEQITDAANKKR